MDGQLGNTRTRPALELGRGCFAWKIGEMVILLQVVTVTLVCEFVDFGLWYGIAFRMVTVLLCILRGADRPVIKKYYHCNHVVKRNTKLPKIS